MGLTFYEIIFGIDLKDFEDDIRYLDKYCDSYSI